MNPTLSTETSLQVLEALQDQDLTDWQLRLVWLAHIDHSLMGFHPLMYLADEIETPLFCDQEATLQTALRQAPARRFKKMSAWMLFSKKRQLGYLANRLFALQPSDIQGYAVVDQRDIQIIASKEPGISWAPGVLGAQCSEAEYERRISQ